MIPATFVFAKLGSGIGNLLADGGHPDLSLHTLQPVLLPIGALIILALLPIIYKRWRARRGAD